jgi:putative toxin-antitoxin system antitoxin component (TIGR02293 family)
MSEDSIVPPATASAEIIPLETGLIARASRLMGGKRLLRHQMTSQLDVHDAVEAGLPGAALHHLIGGLKVLDIDLSLEKAVGLSRRTFQRSKEAPQRPLSPEQSGRAWKFAEVLALATDVFGTQEAAERWLEEPAFALNQRRPIDLLQTPAGTAMVETLLRRIDYGVYT